MANGNESFGALAQPNPVQVKENPSPEDKKRLTSEWEQFLSKPETQAALLQFAISVTQPRGPGQSTLGQITGAVGAGGAAAGRVAATDRAAEQKRIENERAKQETDIRREGVAVRREGVGVQREGLEVEREVITSREGIAGADRASREAIARNKVAGLKSVLDKAESARTGKPVTRFATPREILASQGNLVPVPTGVQLQTTPEGGLSFSTGGLPLPAATETRLRQNVRGGQELLTNLGTLFDQLEEGGAQVSGPLGFFKGIVNVTAASVIPGTFSKDRALFERQLKITREASKRAVSDEERFTDQDRAFVQELFPTTGPFGNPQTADAKLQVMSAFFLRRLGPDMQALGADTAQVPTLELIDVLRLGGAKLLTPVEVRRSAELLFDEPLELKSSLQAMVDEGLPNEEMDKIVRQLFPGALK